MKRFYIKKNGLYFTKRFRFEEKKDNAMNFTIKDEAIRIMNSNIPAIERSYCEIVRENYEPVKENKENNEKTGYKPHKIKLFIPIKNKKIRNIAFEAISGLEKKVKISENLYEIESKLEASRDSLEKRCEYLSEKMSLIDKEIVDIMHYIEFNEFSEKDGYEAYMLLHKKTKERREVKNEYYDILCILDTIDGKKDLKSCKEHFMNHNKPYVPRALPELFQKAMSSLYHC